MSSEHTEETSNRSTRYRRLVFWAIAIIGMVLLFRFLPVAQIRELVEVTVAQAGLGGRLLFVAVYALFTVLAVPASPLTLLAGAVLGVAEGFLWVSIGANLGAFFAFLLARSVLRGYVEAWLSKQRFLLAIGKAVEAEGWRVVLLTRLSPVFPFNVQNFGYGLTSVSSTGYVLGTLIGMIPGTLLYVLIGASGGEALSGGGSTWSMVVKLIGIVATVAVSVLIARRVREQLQRITATENTADQPASESSE